MAEDLGEKTEPASAKRRQELRNRGSVPRSQDLAGALALGGGMLVLLFLAPLFLRDWQAFMAAALEGEFGGLDHHHDELVHELSFTLGLAARIAAPFLFAMLVISWLANVWQVGWLLTLQPLQPSLSKLSPLSGAKKLFSLRSLVKTGTNFFKVLAVLGVAIVYIGFKLDLLLLLPRLEFAEATAIAGRMLVELCLWLVLALIIIGVIDYAYQKWQWEKDNRMSKHEVKEEFKQMQGDPKVKQRQRNMARKILQQRLGKSVPTADVIVTNPEHLAIALKYDPDKMGAPKVVAKGADYLALRIRQIAALHGIPIVERKPLARAMYPIVQIGQEIPGQFYAAVAEILAYVYQLEGRKAG